VWARKFDLNNQYILLLYKKLIDLNGNICVSIMYCVNVNINKEFDKFIWYKA